jgi:hypothetical protein
MLYSPDIGTVCRGAKDGVKGLDRLSGGVAALDTARASAMLRLSGECQQDFVQCKTSSKLISLS